MIKSVVFDVDGVLLDSFQANLKLFQDLMHKAGYLRPTAEEYEKLFHLSGTEVVRILSKTDSPEEIERIHNLRLNSVRYPTELLSMPDDAVETLLALQQSYTLGIVTSRIRSGIFESPELRNLKQLFTTVVGFEDTETHKPSPEPLLLALKNLQTPPTEAVYIGDALTDLEAAQKAGTHFIFYSSENLDSADASVAAFKDLPKAIKFLK